MRWRPDQPVDGFTEQRLGRLNVAVGGEAHAPTIVLVHGLGSTWRFWRPLLAPLANHFRVVAIDAPGFGRSDLLDGDRYDLGAAASRIVRALDELDVERAMLVGHSFGGGLVGRTTVDHPTRVDRLAMLAPAGFVRGTVRDSWRRPTVARIAHVVQRVGLPLVAASAGLRTAIFSRFVHDPSQLALHDALQLGHDSTTSRQGSAAGIAIVEQGLLDRAGEIAVPTLVQWGDADRVVGYRNAARITASIADARLVTYHDAGHALPYEAGVAEVVTRDLLDFCAGGKGAPSQSVHSRQDQDIGTAAGGGAAT